MLNVLEHLPTCHKIKKLCPALSFTTIHEEPFPLPRYSAVGCLRSVALVVILPHDSATSQSAVRKKKTVLGVVSMGTAASFDLLFGQLRQQLGGRLFYKSQEMEIAVREWLLNK